MNPQSDTAVDSQVAASPAWSEPRPLYWSIRREIWENRSIYIAPLIVAAIVLFASLLNTGRLPGKMRNADPAKQRTGMVRPLQMAPAPIMLASFIVGLMYSLDALYGERRDRSILFWKSLPVSDHTAVLSKVAIPIVVLPAIALVLSFIVQMTLLFVSTLIVAGSGHSPGPMWADINPPESLIIMTYGLGVHALWFAPIYAWLILVSAWAKRAVTLWAIFPALAIPLVERIVFGTTYFMNMLQYRVTGAMREAFTPSGAGGNVERFSQLAPVNYLTALGLWVGLGFTALCVVAAIKLRRNREPI